MFVVHLVCLFVYQQCNVAPSKSFRVKFNFSSSMQIACDVSVQSFDKVQCSIRIINFYSNVRRVVGVRVMSAVAIVDA